MGAGPIPIPELVRAIEIYLDAAYPDELHRTRPPAFLNLSPDSSLDDLLMLPEAEALPGAQVDGRVQPTGYSFRLGNQHFPYMKLQVRPIPQPPGFMLAIDTHDMLDPALLSQVKQEKFKQLQDRNREISRTILRAWENAGLPTQRSVILESLRK